MRLLSNGYQWLLCQRMKQSRSKLELFTGKKERVGSKLSLILDFLLSKLQYKTTNDAKDPQCMTTMKYV